MKRIFKYGAFALLALLVSATFQSCDDDKDIVMITEELPLKVDHLYMVGDATPKGWDIVGTAMTKASSTPLEFTWQGELKVGEFKIALTSTNNDFSGDWLQAPAAGTEVNASGIDKGNVVKGGDDNKWKVTAAGTYKITVNFSTKKITITRITA